MPALLFDFDGVIVHSESLHCAAIRDTFAARGMTFTEEAYYERYVAYADRDLFPIIARDCSRELAPSDLRVMLEDKWTRFASLVRTQGVHRFDATLALIREAHEQRVTIALVTAAMRRDVDLILGALGVLEFFATIVTADDVPVSKPDPAPYALACRRLNITPHTCVALEDTPAGIASALAAGCRVVGVAHTLPAHRLSHATRVVASSRDLTLADMLALTQ
jgi:beta-phosphoglucomutase